MYARGILFGKMVLELGDTCVAKNDQTGVRCDVEFKTKVLLIDRNERECFSPHIRDSSRERTIMYWAESGRTARRLVKSAADGVMLWNTKT